MNLHFIPILYSEVMTEEEKGEKNILKERITSVLQHSSNLNTIVEAFSSLDNANLVTNGSRFTNEGLEGGDLRLHLEYQNIQIAKQFLVEFDKMKSHIDAIDQRASGEFN